MCMIGILNMDGSKLSLNTCVAPTMLNYFQTVANVNFVPLIVSWIVTVKLAEDTQFF